MQLMALRLLEAAGMRPDAVVIEYWPPFVHQEGLHREDARIVPQRLFPADVPFVRDYFLDPAAAEKKMRESRLNPVFANRLRLLTQVVPQWIPWGSRGEIGAGTLDPWGWLPGLVDAADATKRQQRIDHCKQHYDPIFANYVLSPLSDRAFRELLDRCRDAGIRVAFVYMPESAEFRAWYPPAVDAAAKAHLAGLSAEYGAPVIDARLWMPDDALVDGFHLSQRGAAEFTAKYAPAVAAAFAGLRRR